MPDITTECPTCGEIFTACSYPNRTPRRYCSQQCWLKRHNNPERNAKVARESAKKRGDIMRDSGTEDTYRKVDSRHEHRTVMEQKLGRKLLPGEIVHHEDENKRNNDPGNLKVTTRPEHARHHFAKWRRERDGGP